jgi:hypothetical protein
VPPVRSITSCSMDDMAVMAPASLVKDTWPAGESQCEQ